MLRHIPRIPICAALSFVHAASATRASAQELEASRGIAEARRGAVVVLCRHGMTDSADENEMTLRYDDPTTQRRLSRRGERQSESLGRAFRALGIQPTEVIASPMQRARLTAELAFGRVTLDSTWHTRGENYSGPKRDRRLTMLGNPVRAGVRVIVSHIGTIYSVVPSIQGRLEEGDCAVLRPENDSRHDVIGVVPWRSWLRAAQLPDSITRR